MGKKRDTDLAELLEGLVHGLKGTVDNQKEFSKLLDRIIDLIEYLMRTVSFIIFILSGLVMKVFLWTPLNELMDKLGDKWTSLSEGFQLLLLGFPLGIIAALIGQIAGSLLLSKIKEKLKKD